MTSLSSLIEANFQCADCYAEPVLFASLRFWVLLCAPCASHHQELNLEVKSFNESFSLYELEKLASQGNDKVNAHFCKAVHPWYVQPKDFPVRCGLVSHVRIHWIRAKYIQMRFCVIETMDVKRHDLDKYWFYLDEYTNELTQSVGPVTRSDLRSLASENTQFNSMCYVWHPALGVQWVVFDKVKDIITTPPGKTDEMIHQECERRIRLMNLPLPHLRGYVKITHKNKSSTKWLMLVGRFLTLSPSNTDTSSETEIDLAECDLQLVDSPLSLSMKINAPQIEVIVSSIIERGSEEVLEWYNEIRCTRYLLQVLGEDFPKPYVDQNELHISNVRNSIHYMGEKLYEGFLRKEGSVWRSVLNRWFVLRTQGLYYYTSKGEKTYKGMIPLKDARVENVKQYRYPHHLALVSGKKTLHLWADNAAIKEQWANVIGIALRQRSQ